MAPRFPATFATSLLLYSCGYVGLNLEKQEQEQDDASQPPLGLGGSGTGGTPTVSTGGNANGGGTGGALVTGGTGSGMGGSSSETGGSGGRPDTSTGGTAMTEPLFAEDFEDDILGMATTVGGATLKLTDERSHTGEGSLVATQGEPGVGAVLQYKFMPVLNGDLYVRGWVYIPGGTVNGRIKLVAFKNSDILFDVNVTAAGRVDLYIQDTDERSTSEQNAHPYDEWFCLQAHYLAHPTQGFVEAFINEESVARIDPQDTRGGNGVTAVDIGLNWTELDQTGGVVYWDDIAIDTVPVPCAL